MPGVVRTWHVGRPRGGQGGLGLPAELSLHLGFEACRSLQLDQASETSQCY